MRTPRPLRPKSQVRLAAAAFAAVLAAAVASHAAAPAAAAQAPATLALRGSFSGPLGLQLYSVRDAMKADVPGTLARVRALGIREVELAGTYGMPATAFRAILDRAGLRATSMHVGYDRMRDSIDAVFAEARVLGVRYVGVAWLPHQQGQPYTVAMARAAAADFTRWGRAARARGLRFFYHIHGYEFRAGADGVLPMDVMMRETPAGDVSFELDTFWAALPGVDPAALLRKYPGRWALMHLKDLRRGVPTGDHSAVASSDSTEVPVGTGQIDFPAVLRAARATGVARYYLEDETTGVFTTLPRSTAWLARVRF